MTDQESLKDQARSFLERTRKKQEENKKLRVEAAKKREGPPREELGLQSGELELKPYNPMWPYFFEVERENLTNILGNDVVIEHVGSTSIRGMPAKPIVDIVVGFNSHRAVEEAIPKMLKEGYRYIPEANRMSRSKFFAKGQPRLFHIHLLEIGESSWQNYIYFRNYLRSNFSFRDQYTKLKEKLVKESSTGDKSVRQEYARKKSSFINIVSMRAIRQMRYHRYYKFVHAASENQYLKIKNFIRVSNKMTTAN